ncbi:lytic transglycosylase domain-containing protein [Paraburkholderia acidicola]|uniref:Lytic transglycosylase domain-containing protein n=1 Tax=Paraburkholderia acidicola TaxID=1912599 RepID=A0ABV1LTE4_9BURK
MQISHRIIYSLAGLVSFGLCPLAVQAQAQAQVQTQTDCFTAAAQYQHVSPLVLRAIAWQESHANARAIHHNANGSTDYGMMQINSIHLPALSRYGISVNDLIVPCKNVFIAAWYLHRMTAKYGNTWTAIGAYHSETPAERDRYAHSIEMLVARFLRVEPNDDPS